MHYLILLGAFHLDVQKKEEHPREQKKAAYSRGDVKEGISENNNKSPVGILASLRGK
jgi:hypothetical protein